MKVIVQIVEGLVGITIVLLLGGKLLNAFNLNFMNDFRELGNLFSQAFGFSYYSLFFALMSCIFVVMAGRWIISWASGNGGQTPNNNGN